MKKTKKLLSLLTALAMTASAFAAMVIPASAEEKYTLDVSDVTATLTKTVEDQTQAATVSVADYGTGNTDVGIAAIPQLDGWGYMHFAYDGTSGRQSSAHVVAADNVVFAQGVGNNGCNGAISFIPKNVDNLSLSDDSVIVYKFDAVVTTTGGSAQGSPTFGFTSAADGSTVTPVDNVALAATGVNNEAITYKMVMVYDQSTDAYTIYVDGLRQKEGTSADITGIYTQTVAKYIKNGIKDLVVSEEETAPIAVKVTFKGDGDTTIQEYESVLEGTILTAPNAPSVSGKTFKEWHDASGAVVTEFKAGATDTVYTAVYEEGSTISTVNVTSNAFAKITLTKEGETPLVKYTDVTGKVDFADIPQGDYSYKIEKTGYTAKEGTFTLGITNYALNDTAVLDDDHKDCIYFETDWKDGSGTYTIAEDNANGGNRGWSTNIAPAAVTLPDGDEDGTPDVYAIHIKAELNRVGTRAGSESTLALKSGSDILLGLQWGLGNGVDAFTGWTGSSTMSADSDLGKYTDKVNVTTDYVADEIAVDFIVDGVNNTITVRKDNATLGTMPLTKSVATLDSVMTGFYREYGVIKLNELSIDKPDANLVSVSGVTTFAKIQGKTVTRTYKASPVVSLPDETFTWTMEPATVTGVTLDAETGVLSVEDTAPANQKITITATGSSAATKKGSLDVTIADFQELTLTAEGAKAYQFVADAKGKYEITSATDSCGDDLVAEEMLPAPVWSSSDTNVATIDAATGELTIKGKGNTTVTATIANGDKSSKIEIPVVVDTYYITGDVSDNAASTEVDLANIVKADKYIATTAKADGTLVKQTEITAPKAEKTVADEAGVKITAVYKDSSTLTSVKSEAVAKDADIDLTPADANTKVFFWKSLASMEPAKTRTEAIPGGTTVSVDTTDAAKYEIAPIFETTMNTEVLVPADRYNITVTANNGDRTDVYVNNQMIINNLNQGCDNWDVTRTKAQTADYAVEDVVISEGYAKFVYQDHKADSVNKITFVKAPSIVTRAKRMYVVGDSLVAKYYGDASKPEWTNLVRTGWGDVLQDYVKGVKVTNLGNSGAWAAGMINDAFTNIAQSAQKGDIVVWEFGYNDDNHGGNDPMLEAAEVGKQICDTLELELYIVTPNASEHDYRADVKSSATMRTWASENNVNLIDLAKQSYAFFTEHYGTMDAGERTPFMMKYYSNAQDSLHSTFNAANAFAAIVAQDLPAEYQNTEHTFTIDDGTETPITVGVGKMPTLD